MQMMLHQAAWSEAALSSGQVGGRAPDDAAVAELSGGCAKRISRFRR
jgi:hypothetical protein